MVRLLPLDLRVAALQGRLLPPGFVRMAKRPCII